VIKATLADIWLLGVGAGLGGAGSVLTVGAAGTPLGRVPNHG
jgi:hypothetical protein